MTTEKLKQLDEEALYVYLLIKNKAEEALQTFGKSFSKFQELEELYYMVDDDKVNAELQTAKTEVAEARASYYFWLRKAEEHKTGK